MRAAAVARTPLHALIPGPVRRIPSPPMRTVFAFLLLAVVGTSQAQTDPRVFTPYTPPAQGTTAPAAAQSGTVQTTAGDSGHVIIEESPRITALMKEYAATKQPLRGFRVQIFLGDRTKGEEIRRAFLVHHPELPAYLSYLAPNFRVRVGDLRNKREALRLRADLKDEFPGLYVVPDDIELPRLAPPTPEKR